MQLDRSGALTPAHVSGVIFDIAHAFDAAGNHHIGSTGLNHHCRRDHRLQTTTAAPVELHASGFYR